MVAEICESKKMKKLIFIILVLVVFVAYCFGSAKNFGYIDLPQYVDKNIDVLGAMSIQEWNSDKAARDERLNELVKAEYQPDKDGFHFGANHSYAPNHTLTEEDYINIVKEKPALAQDLSVRDPEAIIELAGMSYLVRDNVVAGNGQIIAESGELLSKSVLDKLLENRISRIKVVGNGGVVSIETGTMLIVPLIFLALLAALKLIMFDPLVKIMDERSEEIDEGVEQVSKNKVEAEKLARESKDMFDHVRREYALTLSKTKHEIALDSESIIREASDEALKIREEAQAELHEKLVEVENTLRGMVSELAQDIVNQVIKGDKA